MKKKKAHKPPTIPPVLYKRAWRTRHQSYRTIREYAMALIQLVRYRDEDGRDIGFDYEYIREEVLQKFPRVTCNGPHKGRLTKMPYKELQEFAGDLNRQGVRLPFRPFRPRRKPPNRSKKLDTATAIRKNSKGKSDTRTLQRVAKRSRAAS